MNVWQSSVTRARRGRRAIITAFLTLGLAFPASPVVFAQEADLALAKLGRQRRMLEAALAHSPGHQPDLAGLRLDASFMEPEELGALVASEYGFELYRGLLRGADGVHLSGAGNSLDLSVFLASLLGDAGYDTRVAVGSLARPDAERLLARVTEARVSATGPVSEPATLAELAEAGGVAETELRAYGEALLAVNLAESTPFLEAAAAGDLIAATLSGAGLMPVGEAHEELVAEASEYAWVEYRLGTADWTPLHPAFGAHARPVVVADEYLEGSVPERLQHRLRIEMGIERKQGDVFSEELIMTPWERPLANVNGVNLSLATMPLGLGPDAALADLAGRSPDSLFFVPMFGGELAPGAQAFDVMGNLLSPEDAASAMAGVFQTVAGKLNSAAGALGGLGGSEPTEELPFALVAQFVDIVHVAPGGAERRQRRYLFDRRPVGERIAGGTALRGEADVDGLVSTMEFMVTTSALPFGYLQKELTGQALDYVLATERLAQAGGEMDMNTAVADLRPRDQLLLMGLFEAVGHGHGGVAYRHGPTVVALRQSLGLTGQRAGVLGVDIVFSDRRFLREGEAGIEGDSRRAILAGAWDTAVERQYLLGFTPDVRSAYDAFQGPTPRLGVLGVDDDLATAGVPEAAWPALRRDLEAGNVVVYSAELADSGAPFSWWRVNRSTGATLGIGSDGQGEAATEYLVGAIPSLAFAAALSVPGAALCMSATGDEQLLCFCDLVVGNVIFLSLGIAIAGAVAGATLMVEQAVGAASFLVGDVAVGVIGLSPLGGPCSWANSAMSDRGVSRCVLS